MLRCLFLFFLTLLASGCAHTPKAADPTWRTPPHTVTDPETGIAYRLEQTFIRSGQHEIASTLLMPSSAPARGAVIFVAGSRTGLASPEDALPRRLVTRGVAVLLLGNKGVGASGGDWQRETFEDRAANVQAAVDWLARQPGIDPARIGLYGHSQGGYIAGIMAARGRGLRFAVLAAAPAQRVREQIASDDMYIRMRDGGLTREQARAATARSMLLLDAGMALCPLARVHYLCGIYRYDPIPDLERARIPVLVLYGERDNMAPPEENLVPMRQALARAGVPHTVTVLPGANHQFWKSVRGTPSEYEELVAGRTPRFPFLEAGNVRHERALRLRTNRAEYANGYFEAVLGFIGEQLDTGDEKRAP